MRNMYRTLLAAVLMIGFASLNAQNSHPNQCTITKAHSRITSEGSNNTNVKSYVERVSAISSTQSNNTFVRANTPTHTLSIKPDGNWMWMTIYGDNGFSFYLTPDMAFPGMPPMEDGFEMEVDEGSYDIFLDMSQEKDGHYYLAYEINVNQDVYMNPGLEEACYSVHLDPRDENGQPFTSHSFLANFINMIIYDGHGNNIDWSGLCGNGFVSDLYTLHFNSLNNSCFIAANQRIDQDNQTSYFIAYPIHIGQLDSDLWLTNDFSEMETYQAIFNMHTPDSTIYETNFNWYSIDEEGLHSAFKSESASDYGLHYLVGGDTIPFDPTKPIRLITNNKVDDPSLYYGNGYRFAMPFISAYEKRIVDGTEYYEKVASPAIYYTNNNWVSEPIDAVPFVFPSKVLDHLDPFTPTPLARYMSIGQTAYFGDRTPILYWQAENFGPSTSFWGDTYISGPMEFIGDNGCIRKCDENTKLSVIANGEEVYNDFIYNYNYNSFDPIYIDEPCELKIEINDTYLVDEGVLKANRTLIALDLNHDDAMPPTMTVLRVLSEYGQENVYLPSYSNANITFAAGDFEPHDAGYYYDKMQYKGKPEVEVFYAIEGGEWMPLQYIEDETLFHVNYGNVFTINLSQLNTDAANHWIDLKFSLTDEAGNSQVQELRNVFFTGEQVSVSESIGPEHSVYPNPFNEEVHIRTTKTINGEVHVNVYSILGEKVYDKTVNCNGESELVIEGSHLESGVYFYDIVAESGKIRGKIIKE